VFSAVVVHDGENLRQALFFVALRQQIQSLRLNEGVQKIGKYDRVLQEFLVGAVVELAG
jgi:hypothetical protein